MLAAISMRSEATHEDAAAAHPPAQVYVPPREFLRDVRDARAYQRATLALVLTLYVSLAAALAGWLPVWGLAAIVPLVYLRLALALHELLHVCPAEDVSWFHRLTMVLETPFCLGYREHRAIHFLHHRYASTDRDPERFQIVGGPWTAFARAMVSPEHHFISWARTQGVTARMAVEVAVRAIGFAAVAAINLPVFLVYWVALRFSVGFASYVFHYVLHNDAGALGTFPLPVSPAVVRAAEVLFGREPMLILTEHERHHQWPRVRARDLVQLPPPPA
jgi:fatty acid desaturase